jgi:hypothetical protein
MQLGANNNNSSFLDFLESLASSYILIGRFGSGSEHQLRHGPSKTQTTASIELSEPCRLPACLVAAARSEPFVVVDTGIDSTAKLQSFLRLYSSRNPGQCSRVELQDQWIVNYSFQLTSSWKALADRLPSKCSLAWSRKLIACILLNNCQRDRVGRF